MRAWAWALAGLVLALTATACATSPAPGSASSSSSQAATEVGGRWDGTADVERSSRFRSVTGLRGMVVSDDRLASEWGAEVLRRGGNAVDAAVATAFALAVTRPHYGSLGGGGFLLYCPAPQGGRPRVCETIDYRERAPARAHRNLFIRDGKAVPELSQDGALAVGVPGVVAGLLLASEQWGRLPRQRVLERPIRWARDGIGLSSYTESAAAARWDSMNPEARRLFGCLPDGRTALQAGASGVDGRLKPCPVGTRLRQADLARVLEGIRDRGRRAFYEGEFARKLATGLQGAGGILTEQDLKDYRAERRAPVVGKYRGLEVVAMAPPSAGGGTLLQMLAYADRADRTGEFDEGWGASRTLHAQVHAMRLAFADRASHYGDPGYVAVPIQGLLDPAYLDLRWKTFRSGSAREVAEAGTPDAFGKQESPEVYPAHEGSETTHFSVVDAQGNAVAVTTTVNDYFGSAFVAPGTGVVLNNEMDDFAAQPGVPNLFGLVGAEANSVAGGKRPLSSMTPTVVRDSRGEARLILGAQGGPRITTSVYQAIVNRVRFGMSLPEAVLAPRIHHQWKPEKVFYDRQGFGEDVLSALRRRGYALEPSDSLGRMQAIERFPANGRVWGVPDPRTEGAAVAE